MFHVKLPPSTPYGDPVCSPLVSDQNPEPSADSRGGGHPLPPLPARPRTCRCGRDREGRRRRPSDLRRRGPRNERPVPGAGRTARGGVRDGGYAPARRLRVRRRGRQPDRGAAARPARARRGGVRAGLLPDALAPSRIRSAASQAHIAMSNEFGKPMVVHVRDAWPDVLRVLDEGSAERVVIHCFSGDAQIARECAQRGYWISFAGNVTYPKNEHLRQAAATLPIDRLLVETDSPFLVAADVPRPRQRARERRRHHRGASRACAREPVQLVTDAISANARAAFPGLR